MNDDSTGDVVYSADSSTETSIELSVGSSDDSSTELKIGEGSRKDDSRGISLWEMSMNDDSAGEDSIGEASVNEDSAGEGSTGDGLSIIVGSTTGMELSTGESSIELSIGLSWNDISTELSIGMVSESEGSVTLSDGVTSMKDDSAGDGLVISMIVDSANEMELSREFSNESSTLLSKGTDESRL